MNRDSESSISPMGWVCVPLRMQLGALFLLAAYNKLVPQGEGPTSSGPQGFLWTIKAFKFGLPDWMVLASTFAMPWIELIAAVLLILGIWTRAAAAVIAALLAMFIVMLLSVIMRKLNVECGCFGDISPFCKGPVGWCHIYQDFVMLAVAVMIMLTPRHGFALSKTG